MKFSGTSLRRLRRRAKLSAEELAARARLDPLTVKHLEAGISTPHSGTVGKLARALGITVDALFNGGRR